ncbi:uncharacterized protein LOC124377357, partial [Tachysurus ichikawai]
MAAQGTRVYDTLTRRHGVRVATGASVEDCCHAAGDVVGDENVLAASRMNSAVVLFVSTIERADLLAQKGIVVGGSLTHETLERDLSCFGKLVSPIKVIPIGSKSARAKHVVSFRRFTYMILNSNITELERTLTYKRDGVDHVIYVSTNSMKCFGCGKTGHLVRACPRAAGGHI